MKRVKFEGIVSLEAVLHTELHDARGARLRLDAAERAGAQITEVNGSHVIMISQPQAVADVIQAATAKLA